MLNYDILVMLGPIGGGKDFTCNKLQENGFVRLDFKDALLEATWALLGWKPDTSDQYEAFKCAEFKTSFLADDKFFHLQISGRRILERLGTECIRQYLGLPDIWIEKWINKYEDLDPGTKICVGDCRFENEVISLIQVAEKNKLNIGFVVCDYKSNRYDNSGDHPSRRLVQHILELGYKDQDIISAAEIKERLRLETWFLVL